MLFQNPLHAVWNTIRVKESKIIYLFSQSGVATLELAGKIHTMWHQVAKIPGNQIVKSGQVSLLT